MADVRAQAGVPVAAQFGGLETPTMCAPLVVDSATGIIYSLKTGDVVVAAGAGGTVTSVAVSGGTTGLTTSGGPITTSGTITFAGTLAVANGGTGVTALGTGVVTALGVNVGSAGAFVTFNGALGTPSSGTLTNATGLPVGGISGLGANIATFLATPSSANLAAALTDELGSGKAIFGAAGTTWTPTGNNVSLTDNGSKYIQLGPVVFAQFDVTWPATADTSAALIKSLPIAASGFGVTAFGYTDYGAAFTGLVGLTLSTAVDLFALTAVALTNINVSTKRFIGTAVYFSS